LESAEGAADGADVGEIRIPVDDKSHPFSMAQLGQTARLGPEFGKGKRPGSFGHDCFY